MDLNHEGLFEKHKAEVLNACITEYDEKVFVKGIREEGIEIGENETKGKQRLVS